MEPAKTSLSPAAWIKGLSGKIFGIRPARRYKEPAASLVLFVTRRCNLKCATCLKGKSAPEDFDLGLLDDLFSQARRAGYDSVSLSGGEAILHPRFSELLAKISASGLRMGLVTNGLEYKKYLEALRPYRDQVSFVAVSLDSHLRELNDAVRGPGTRDAAVAAARAFGDEGYFLKISHVVNAKNLTHLAGFVDYVNSELKPLTINVGSVICSGGNADLVLSREQKLRLREVLLQLAASHKNLAIASSTGYFSGVLYCGHFSSFGGLTFNTAGEGVFCCDSPGEGFPLGSLRREGFAAIAAKFLRVQAEVKAAVLEARLSGGAEVPMDCDFCAGLLARLAAKK
jgi:MoaA/NifB/PqqE/SkfB family radical SAM enzyme